MRRPSKLNASTLATRKRYKKQLDTAKIGVLRSLILPALEKVKDKLTDQRQAAVYSQAWEGHRVNKLVMGGIMHLPRMRCIEAYSGNCEACMRTDHSAKCRMKYEGEAYDAQAFVYPLPMPVELDALLVQNLKTGANKKEADEEEEDEDIDGEGEEDKERNGVGERRREATRKGHLRTLKKGFLCGSECIKRIMLYRALLHFPLRLLKGVKRELVRSGNAYV